jgi:NAD(P)-dependent dehydrogenase (short-subunit alcohol dehydrogenase family)
MRAIVTGAASGIGRATALKLATDARRRKEDARLLLVDIAAERLEGVAAELRKEKAEAHVFAGDLADPAVPQKIVDAAARALGGLDVVVSNAGILTNALLADLSLNDYDRAFAINTRAAWLLAKAAYPLLKQSSGCLVATASISAMEPTPPLGAYSASKAALVMLIQQLANEWGPDGIRCNCVSPGATHTAMTDAVYGDPEKRAQRAQVIPLQRVGQPEDHAAAIAFLAGPEAAYITGVNLVVDGGVTTTLMSIQRRVFSGK